jgi:autotransporter-associated beta strand protein
MISGADVRRLIAVFCFLLGALIFVPCVQASPPGSGWGLIFADEFSGTTLDTMKWNYNYPWGSTHNHDAYMLPENVTVSNGLLTETGNNQSYGGKPYTSGAINSNGKFNHQYGYYEARIKTSSTQGAWPAFWMLQDGWPPEIDILEVPINPSAGLTVYNNNCALHYSSGGGNASHGSYYYTGADTSAGFHTYGVDWQADHMTFYCDGAAKYTTYDTSAISQCSAMYMIINLAIGGWPGDPLPDATWPITYQVDWVRVWEKTGSYPSSTTWTNSSNGSWDTSSNWSNGSPQLSTQTATFGAVSAGFIQVSWSNSRTVGSVVLNSSTSYALGSSSGSLMLASSSGTSVIDATGVSGSGVNYINARLDLYNNLILRSNPSKPLVINGGITGPGGLRIESGQIVLGAAASYNGATTVTGGSLTLTGNGGLGSTANVELGYETNNVVSVNMTGANSKINGQIIRLGLGSGSQTTLTQSGGTVTAAGDMYVGYLGQAVYNLSGTLNANQNLQIGSFGQGTLSQTGGTATVGGTPSLGRYSTGVGELTISAGAFNQTSTSARLVVGDQGTGTLTVGGSGTLTSQGGIRLGAAPAATGTVNLNSGGKIYTPLVDTSGGLSTWNFNGGQLVATASSAYFMQGLSNAFLQANGAVIDTGANSITIAQALLEGDPAGGLLKKGSGVLTLTGNTTYSGLTRIEDGVLTISGDIVSIGSVELAGGSLGVNSLSASMHDIEGEGLLSVGDGSTAAQLTADSVAVGSLTVAAGAKLTIRPLGAGSALADASQMQSVPEPATWIILAFAAGMAGLIGRRRN